MPADISPGYVAIIVAAMGLVGAFLTPWISTRRAQNVAENVGGVAGAKAGTAAAKTQTRADYGDLATEVLALSNAARKAQAKADKAEVRATAAEAAHEACEAKVREVQAVTEVNRRQLHNLMNAVLEAVPEIDIEKILILDTDDPMEV
jgi:hypothetical protein